MMLDTIDAPSDISSSHPTFLEAARIARELKGLDNDHRLQLYGLYKQSTDGNVSGKRPLLDFVGAAKWDAWKSFEGFPPNSAAKLYAFLVKELLLKETGHGDAKGGLAQVSIFEGMGVSCSTLRQATSDTGPTWHDGESLFEAVVDGSIGGVQAAIAAGSNVNSTNEEVRQTAEYWRIHSH